MANLFDYLAWRGDLEFSVSPFNPVDNLIFSQLAYLTLDDIVPGPDEKGSITIDLAVKIYDEKHKKPEGFKQSSVFKDDPELINALAVSKRFGGNHLFGFVNHADIDRETQFSAVTISIDKTKNEFNNIIAYRGTDASIIGWKESLTMSFKEVIPSQIEAVKYLEKMAAMINGNFCLCGHSKGGNLAIYAASHCSKKTQNRITAVYNNDGPGFHEKIISGEGFTAIKDRIVAYIPQSSIIGMLLGHGYKNTVVKSNQSGLLQHELYSWEVTHNDLVYLNETTLGSRYISKILEEWNNKFDAASREQFIEALYCILNQAEVKSVFDLEVSWFASASRIIKSLNNIDQPTKKLIRQFLVELFRSAGRNINTLLRVEN